MDYARAYKRVGLAPGQLGFLTVIARIDDGVPQMAFRRSQPFGPVGIPKIGRALRQS